MESRRLKRGWLKRLAALLCLPLAGCAPSLQYSVATPPLILTPAKLAGVTDGRSRFREIFCAVTSTEGADFPYHRPCEAALHRLDGEAPPMGRPVHLGPARVKLRILTVPGIFGECAADMATPFKDAVEHLGSHGYRLGYIPVSGRSSSEANAAAIRRWLDSHPLESDEKLVLIGHSKGMSDLLELIGGDRSVVPRGSTVISLSGVVAGTPIADQGMGIWRAVRWIPFPKCPVGDQEGVTSLTRAHRLAYLAQHPLPDDLHYYSLAAFTRAGNISSFLKPTYDALAKIDPRNDGNVIFHDTIIPGSTILGYPNADHWAVAMPFEIYAPKRAAIMASRNRYPRVVLIEAIARAIEESYLDEADQAVAKRERASRPAAATAPLRSRLGP